MPATTFSHSVGVLITIDQTTPFPDEHSFCLGDGTILPRMGWGCSGGVAYPSRNPPEGHVTTVYLVGAFTEAAMTALSDLLAEHAARYKEARVFLGDTITTHPDHAAIVRWVSSGCQPGSTLHGWGTDPDPVPTEELSA